MRMKRYIFKLFTGRRKFIFIVCFALCTVIIHHHWFFIHDSLARVSGAIKKGDNVRADTLYDDGLDERILLSNKVTKNPSIILLAGQSNMEGYGEVSMLENHILSTENQIINASPIINNKRFGPEIGMLNYLEAKGIKDNIIVKFAVGATSQYAWSPYYNIDLADSTGNKNSGALFDDFRDVIKQVRQFYDTDVKALFWAQGERDAFYPHAADEYYENCKILFEEIRLLTGKKELPIYIALINPPDRYKGKITVINAQLRLAKEDENIYIIDTKALPKLADDLHYSTNGVLELGRRFGESLYPDRN
ncbi:MAG: hypothetical protein ACI9WL_001286 [Rubritalea sp.]|jgi:hypothetical protein